ncbi:apolipoprotein L2-like [Nannospalax galili]|uniref:apolipoprotein L2-like n=1 Tax=Nannospalax galili TaxID=1026970 RepID=UPI0004ED3471|nr:apolipoprotein L2-like [Nannospalax galili]
MATGQSKGDNLPIEAASTQLGHLRSCKENLSVLPQKTQNTMDIVKKVALSSESRRVVEEIANYLTDTLKTDYLGLLLTEDAIWEAMVGEAGLSREEEAAIRDALKKCVAPWANKDKNCLQKELQDRKRFLEAFPRLEKKLKEYITQLRDIADHIAQVHKGIAVTNVVTDSTSVASGVMGIVGLILAPFTVGGSLVISAAALGLGAAATVTSVTTMVAEEASRMSDMAKASSLVSNAMGIIKEIAQIMPMVTIKIANATIDLIQTPKSIAQHIRAIKMAKGNPNLIANAKNLTTTGTVSKEVKDVFGGTALALSKGARFRSAGITSIFVALDVYHLVKDSIHLGEGAKSESAEELQQIAQKLEARLKELVQIYKTLQSELPK